MNKIIYFTKRFKIIEAMIAIFIHRNGKRAEKMTKWIRHSIAASGGIQSKAIRVACCSSRKLSLNHFPL